MITTRFSLAETPCFREAEVQHTLGKIKKGIMGSEMDKDHLATIIDAIISHNRLEEWVRDHPDEFVDYFSSQNLLSLRKIQTFTGYEALTLSSSSIASNHANLARFSAFLILVEGLRDFQETAH